MKRLTTIGLLLFYLESWAVEFEKLGTAISKVLGTTKAFQTNAKIKDKELPVFYVKNDSGQVTRLAVVAKGIYDPNCSHTWVIALDAEKAKVRQIRVVEMSCPHAFPTNSASFLAQYKGKGPADIKKLKEQVHTIAKATGSSHLTTDAVISSIQAADSLRGKW